jgi:hypothetical protein
VSRSVSLATIASVFVLLATLLFTTDANAESYRSSRWYRASIIKAVFGPYGGEALRVARCESNLNPKARNGQYRGVFQMGHNERKTYGHGPGVWAQSFAAYRYFVRSGRDWSPWACRP